MATVTTSQLSMAQLEQHLGQLAYQWRSVPLESPEARAIVHEYHDVLAALWQQGWTGEGLLPDAELPDELMPRYFMEYWQQR